MKKKTWFGFLVRFRGTTIECDAKSENLSKIDIDKLMDPARPSFFGGLDETWHTDLTLVNTALLLKTSKTGKIAAHNAV